MAIKKLDSIFKPKYIELFFEQWKHIDRFDEGLLILEKNKKNDCRTIWFFKTGCSFLYGSYRYGCFIGFYEAADAIRGWFPPEGKITQNNRGVQNLGFCPA